MVPSALVEIVNVANIARVGEGVFPQYTPLDASGRGGVWRRLGVLLEKWEVGTQSRIGR